MSPDDKCEPACIPCSLLGPLMWWVSLCCSTHLLNQGQHTPSALQRLQGRERWLAESPPERKRRHNSTGNNCRGYLNVLRYVGKGFKDRHLKADWYSSLIISLDCSSSDSRINYLSAFSWPTFCPPLDPPNHIHFLNQITILFLILISLFPLGNLLISIHPSLPSLLIPPFVSSHRIHGASWPLHYLLMNV